MSTDYSHLTALAKKAKRSDKYLSELWEASIPIATQVARIFASKHGVDAEDLRQAILVEFPKLFNRFDPSRKTEFAKFIFFAFYRAAQDELRKLDPLGIKFPQRKKYPTWRYLQDVSEDSYILAILIANGIDRLDRSEELDLPSE